MSWLDERIYGAIGSVEVRLGLVRMALRRRENIPDLAVMAWEQEQARTYDWPTPSEPSVTEPAAGDAVAPVISGVTARAAGYREQALAELDRAQAADLGQAAPAPASPTAHQSEAGTGPGGRGRLCAHADQDGAGMHWLVPGEPGSWTPPVKEAGAEPGGRSLDLEAG